jgi:DNA-directed RNA polymerase subunit RPC12/RpoP
MIEFRCGNCNQKIVTKDALSGKRVKCPKCSDICTVPDTLNKIKFQCKSCDQKISVPEVHAGKEAKCPRCKSTVVVPQVVPQQLADRETIQSSSQKSDINSLMFDVPPAEDAPAQSFEQQERELFNALSPTMGVQEEQLPAQRKLVWPIDIFLYPLNKAGLMMLGVFIGLPLLMKLVTGLMNLMAMLFAPFIIFAVLFLCISIIVNITVALYLYWYLAFCVRDSAEGNVRAPDVLANTPGPGEMLGQVIKLVGCYTFFCLLIYFYISRARGVDIGFWRFMFHMVFFISFDVLGPVLNDKVFWLLMFFVVFLFPMMLLAVVMFDSIRAFNPFLIISSIFSSFLPYCALLVFFCGICIPIAMMKMFVTRMMIWPGLQILPYIVKLVNIYFLMVGAHILGAFYCRYQDKLNWEV